MKNIHQKNYQICSNCIMDTSDPNITFDERGWCDYCRNYYKNILPNWHTDERGEKELLMIAEKIKKEGIGALTKPIRFVQERLGGGNEIFVVAQRDKQ